MLLDRFTKLQFGAALLQYVCNTPAEHHLASGQVLCLEGHLGGTVRTITHLPDACLQFVSRLDWGSEAYTEEFKGVGVAGANSLQNSAACKAESREAM